VINTGVSVFLCRFFGCPARISGDLLKGSDKVKWNHSLKTAWFSEICGVGLTCAYAQHAGNLSMISENPCGLGKDFFDRIVATKTCIHIISG
jgi:hypothetical protein